MAEPFIKLALKGATVGIEHYDKVYDPLKARVKNMHNPIHRHSNPNSSDRPRYRDEYDNQPPSRSAVDKRVSRQENVPRGDTGRGYVKETYYRESGRARSAGRYGYRGEDRGGRGISRRDQYDSDSDSSLSPPPRRRRETERDSYRDQDDFRYNPDDPPPRAQTFADDYSQKRRMPAGYLGMTNRADDPADLTVSTRRNPAWSETRGSKRSSSTGSSSSSTLPSSSEDEREIKKMKGKEYLSAGLAAVATIHAAKGVISSLDARDKRHLELAKGEITPAEARRKRNKLRLQDVAAIGIAALGIKGAYSEWQDVQESRKEIKSKDEERKKRHEKRVKRAEKRARETGNRGYGGREDDRDGGRRDRRDGRDGRDGYRSA